ncbi:MAG: hypothetical protein U5Q44_13875 [Dehalococcoidia bacterium]|nr:hypothetical protein [Dehalococcoidia bacterium]
MADGPEAGFALANVLFCLAIGVDVAEVNEMPFRRVGRDRKPGFERREVVLEDLCLSLVHGLAVVVVDFGARCLGKLVPHVGANKLVAEKLQELLRAAIDVNENAIQIKRAKKGVADIPGWSSRIR